MSTMSTPLKIMLLGSCRLTDAEIAGYGMNRTEATWLMLRTDATRIRTALDLAKREIERKRLEEDDGA
jgi:hypothetical protein